MESTRYCNYSKNKFGNELTFIEPCWLNKLCDNKNEYNSDSKYSDMFTKEDLMNSFKRTSSEYFAAITAGLSPQEAATILPNAIKTELVMTGYIDDWKHFFRLRALGTTGAPHPQAKELAEPLMEEFIKLNLV